MKLSGKTGITYWIDDMEERYNRHHLIPDFGEAGQEKLKKASALIVGVGGLGSPIALYLVAAGIGRIGLIDNDIVSLTNLQRQILYRESQLDSSKVYEASKTLQQLNSECVIETYPYRLTEENARKLISRYDIVLDGCDNFETRYLIDEVTSESGIPYVYGSIGEFHGQLSVFNYGEAGSYSDLYPKEFAGEKKNLPLGVIGSVPGVVGSLQATEAIKILTGFGNPLVNELLTLDLKNMEFKKLQIG